MVTTIEDLRSLSIHVLKRLGMLSDGFFGILEWKQSGEVVAAIRIYARISGGVSAVVLQYNLTYTGETVTDRINLRRLKSNLPGHTGGYWMFICPVTGSLCRVLYLLNGHFVSRKALPKGVIYKCQTCTPGFRTIGRVFDYDDAIGELYGILLKPYGKKFYRGKPTRIAMRLLNKERRCDNAFRGWSLQQRRGK